MQIFKNFNLSTVKLLYNEHNIFHEEKRNGKTSTFFVTRDPTMIINHTHIMQCGR